MNHVGSKTALSRCRQRELSRCLSLGLAASILLTCGLATAFSAPPDTDSTAANATGLARTGRPRSERAMPATSAQRPPATMAVSDCADDGSPGTLRSVLRDAISGDVVDLTQLSCSLITLQSGALVSANDDVTLMGPGDSALTIDAQNQDSVLIHAGQGVLTVSGLTLANGHYDSDVRFPFGGCVYSSGSVTLTDSTVTACSLTGLNYAYGGSVYARANITLTHTTLTGASVLAYQRTGHAFGGLAFAVGNLVIDHSRMIGGVTQAHYTSNGKGGAAYVVGDLSIVSSTIDGNSATPGMGGGIFSRGGVDIRDSTFSANVADYAAALALSRLYASTPVATITNSTISGNVMNGNGSAVLSSISLTVSNSTIAFNQAYGDYSRIGAGLMVAPGVSNVLQSTIIANNSAAGQPVDFTATDVFNLSGSNDLIMVATNAQPPGTIASDPLLGPLGNHGGPTFTHNLMAGSPAIDAGNNLAAQAFDQRGASFPRVVGASADIGAYEVSGDPIFQDGFDG